MTGNNVSFEDALAASEAKGGPRCVVITAIEGLPTEDDRERASAALANPRVSSRAIARALKLMLGAGPCASSIQAHRSGEHVGCRPSVKP
jgi:hypothetical protein